jgi:hypothetical protein
LEKTEFIRGEELKKKRQQDKDKPTYWSLLISNRFSFHVSRLERKLSAFSNLLLLLLLTHSKIKIKNNI